MRRTKGFNRFSGEDFQTIGLLAIATNAARPQTSR